MRNLVVTSSVWFLAFGAWACGSTTNSGKPSGSRTGAETVQELVGAFCDSVRSCCQKGGFPADPLANCESEFSRQVDIIPLVEKGTVTLNADVFDACVSSVRSAASTCNGASTSACVGAFQGTIPEGASCEKSDECVDTADEPAICLKIRAAGMTTTPATGVCKLAPRGRAGDPCFTTCAPNRSCGSTYSTDVPNPVVTLCHEADGLFCASSGTEKRCAPIPKEGEPCTSFDGCGSNMYCSQTSVCVGRSSAGVVCASSSECATGLTCENGACAPQPLATQKTCGGDFG